MLRGIVMDDENYREKIKCEICNKLILKKRMKRHTWIVHKEGNGEEFKSVKKRTAWNKGLTKETSNSLAKAANTLKKRIADGTVQAWSKGMSKETHPKIAAISKKISEKALEKVKEGTWHNSFSKARTHDYKGMRLYGSWEVEFAKYLDSNLIEWTRPGEKFPYLFEGKVRSYTPDFFLVKEQIFVEIKGYPTDKDFAKWNQFPSHLRIVFGRQLFSHKLISSFKEGTWFKEHSLSLMGFRESHWGWENIGKFGEIVQR